jgi:hypothetical protein
VVFVIERNVEVAGFYGLAGVVVERTKARKFFEH